MHPEPRATSHGVSHPTGSYLVLEGGVSSTLGPQGSQALLLPLLGMAPEAEGCSGRDGDARHAGQRDEGQQHRVEAIPESGRARIGSSLISLGAKRNPPPDQGLVGGTCMGLGEGRDPFLHHIWGCWGAKPEHRHSVLRRSVPAPSAGAELVSLGCWVSRGQGSVHPCACHVGRWSHSRPWGCRKSQNLAKRRQQ